MTAQKEPSAAAAVLGLVLFIVGGVVFELILWHKFGGEIAALPGCLAFVWIGYRLCFVPADGNAGTSGNATGTGYVVRLDPEDPDAGVPRRQA